MYEAFGIKEEIIKLSKKVEKEFEVKDVWFKEEFYNKGI